jgi:hypothetical protein
MPDRNYIRVSELSDFIYCPTAWQLRRNGAGSDPPKHRLTRKPAANSTTNTRVRWRAARRRPAPLRGSPPLLLTGTLLVCYFLYGR